MSALNVLFLIAAALATNTTVARKRFALILVCTRSDASALPLNQEPISWGYVVAVIVILLCLIVLIGGGFVVFYFNRWRKARKLPVSPRPSNGDALKRIGSAV
jgi:hypothetical protein